MTHAAVTVRWGGAGAVAGAVGAAAGIGDGVDADGGMGRAPASAATAQPQYSHDTVTAQPQHSHITATHRHDTVTAVTAQSQHSKPIPSKVTVEDGTRVVQGWCEGGTSVTVPRSFSSSDPIADLGRAFTCGGRPLISDFGRGLTAGGTLDGFGRILTPEDGSRCCCCCCCCCCDAAVSPPTPMGCVCCRAEEVRRGAVGGT